MQLSTELTPCGCWTVWRWLPGRRGWRLLELFFTWLRVSSYCLKVFWHELILKRMNKHKRMNDQWDYFFVVFIFHFIWHWYILFLCRNLCRVQHWSWGAALDEIQHLSAAGCGDLICSGGTSQHGDWVCSQFSAYAEDSLNYLDASLTFWATFSLMKGWSSLQKCSWSEKLALVLPDCSKHNICWLALQGYKILWLKKHIQNLCCLFQ